MPSEKTEEDKIVCLGIPGELLEIYKKDEMPMGKVDFGGIAKEICLAYTPDAQVGQYVLVHVGFAISVIDEKEADEIIRYIKEIAKTIEEEDQQRREIPGLQDTGDNNPGRKGGP